MGARGFGDRRRSFAVLVAGLTAGALIATTIILAGCEDPAAPADKGMRRVVQEKGAIAPTDARDPNHADLPYDAHVFEARKFDRVRVDVAAEGFTPLVKLVEVSTGAPIAEWEQQYSAEDALLYTIAAPGRYEARVYALGGETGTYRIDVTLND